MKKILAGLFLVVLFMAALPTQAQEVISATDKTFTEEIKSGYVIVDFWATWCPPCRAFAPIFSSVSEEFAGKVKFVKVDIDKSPKTAITYSISAIPTLILFKDGKQVNKWVGGLDKDSLRSIIKNAIE